MGKRSSLWEDTIVAISSPPGSGGRGIVRLSGDKAFPLFLSSSSASSLSPRVQKVDLYVASLPPVSALVFLFTRPRSYTGEDVVELHLSSSPPLLQATVQHFLHLGARLAQPGEFTRRALENGRIDLYRATAILGLIEAEEEEELNRAQRFLNSDVGRELQKVHESLKGLLAELHAYVDFPDYDVAPEEEGHFHRKVEEALTQLQQLDWAFRQAEKIRGNTVALWGKVNVGKSTLFNQLLGRDVALVSEVPFTTRDRLSEEVCRQGQCWTLWDLPGWGDAKDPLEKLAFQRGKDFVAQADLVLFLLEGEEPDTEEERAMAYLEEKGVLWRLVPSSLRQSPEKVWQVIEECAPQGGGLFSLRQLEVYERALEALLRAKTVPLEQVELMGLDVEESLEALAKLLGEVDYEEILDMLFSRFCIGK